MTRQLTIVMDIEAGDEAIVFSKAEFDYLHEFAQDLPPTPERGSIVNKLRNLYNQRMLR